ncbi:peptidase inhibitor family I36 protein [Streptomyces sp. NPDC093707]|uniref:peptidase inhibitor family I36 protein n=1 Tax=Streptomyces sp. NPDC093707 TaxID=3154984 RepID=UPI00344DB4D4
MKNRLRRSAATLAGFVLASTGLATVNAASAAADAYACPAGYFCGWSGENATGQMYKTNKSVADLGSWDNKIHTYVNRTSSIACVYEDKNYVAWGGYFPPASQQRRRIQFVPDGDDQLDQVRPHRTRMQPARVPPLVLRDLSQGHGFR